jgi:hypothetical protein
MVFSCKSCWLGFPFLAVAMVHASTLYVSPGGNDTWSGTLLTPNSAHTDGPLASLVGARDAVRALKAKGPLTDTLRIQFADGEYVLSATVVFTPADAGTASSPILYEAMAGAHPRFLGGTEIKGFQVGVDGVWRVKIPEVAEGKWMFEQLFVGGRRGIRAREPNLIPDTLFDIRLLHSHLSANTTKSHFTIQDIQETDLGGGKARQTIIVDPVAGKVLANIDATARKDLVLMVYHNWDNTRRFTTGFSSATNALATEGDAMKTWNPWKQGNLFHVENFKQALDAPGEWFLDRDGTLAYVPRAGESPASLRFFAPRIDKWISIQGKAIAGQYVEYISMHGLSFLYSQWLTPPEGFEPSQAATPLEASIMVDGANHLKFSNCEFAHTGEYAIWFRKGCQNILLEHSFIHDLGAGAIRIGENGIASNINERTSHITIDNNIIRSGGLLFPCAVGLLIGQSGDNGITHNDIGDLSYTGISSGWTWGYGENLAKRNRIEANHLHHLGKGLMSDMSGYYNLGLSEGTTVTRNLVHDIYAWSYGGWGLYTDEGSTGVTMSDNLVYNTKTGGFHQHYGEKNIIKNNIFAYGVQWQIQFTKVETHRSFDFTGNIVYWDSAALYAGPFKEGDVGLAKNLFWDASGRTIKFPTVITGQGTDLNQWQVADHDSGSRIADPLFIDPGHYDFRFQSASPTSSIGFKPFDITGAGVYGEASWKIKAQGNESTPETPLPILSKPNKSIQNRIELHKLSITPGGLSLNLSLVLAEFTSQLEVEVLDGIGKRTSYHSYHGLRAGSIDLSEPFSNGKITSGTYMIRLKARFFSAKIPGALSSNDQLTSVVTRYFQLQR